jgi:AbrB family looped-hinge helix DNA binding protein
MDARFALAPTPCGSQTHSNLQIKQIDRDVKNTIILTYVLLLRGNIMETTKLSSKGQVVIPGSLRKSHHWESGQELVVIDVGDGILLKSAAVFEETQINDVASCLKYTGETRSLEDMELAILKGVKEKVK